MTNPSSSRPTPGGAGPQDADAPDPVRLLVVDDNDIDGMVAGNLVKRGLGWDVAHAGNGAQALAAFERRPPDLVLTDLHMPEMDGLELVQTVRRRWPLVPVVLMTAYGNEEIAIEALRQGAASYVPKKSLEHDLVETLARVEAMAGRGRQRQRLLECVNHAETEFVLENDRTLVSALVALLQEGFIGMGLGDETERIRVGVALEEALTNALYHGNLEISSELRQRDDGAYVRLADERMGRPPYRDRRIRVTVRLSPEGAYYDVRDEGPGFDVAAVPDPRDPANLEKASGRGLLLIRTFMDEVAHNAAGNQIIMRKRRKDAAVGERP